MNGDITQLHVSRPEYSDIGPFGIFDAYCVRCAKRTVTVSSIHDESLPFWWCPDCEAWTVTHHRHPEGTRPDDESGTA